MLVPNWLRKIVQRYTKPISEERAYFWTNRISLAYALIAWNALGFVIYQVYQGNSDWAKAYKSDDELKKTPAQQWASTLGIKEAKVYRISGLKLSQYDIKHEEEKDSSK